MACMPARSRVPTSHASEAVRKRKFRGSLESRQSVNFPLRSIGIFHRRQSDRQHHIFLCAHIALGKMFESLCSLPLSGELFTQALHPTEPLITVGLSSGHVSTLKLPPVEDEEAPESSPKRRGSDGTGVIDTAWRTRRHQGSCRTLAYSIDGR